MLRALMKKEIMKRKIACEDLPESQIRLTHAIRVAKSLAVARPESKIAINVRCKSGDASVRELRGSVLLPVGFMKTKTLVFATGAAADQAREAGAEIVGGQELIQSIIENELKFDRVIATPELMPHVNKIARYLGPMGLMPTVKKGTVTDDVAAAIHQQADAVIFKADVNGFISAVIGKAGMVHKDIETNVGTFLRELKSIKKGKQTRFVEKLSLQVECMGEEAIDLAISKAEFNL